MYYLVPKSKKKDIMFQIVRKFDSRKEGTMYVLRPQKLDGSSCSQKDIQTISSLLGKISLVVRNGLTIRELNVSKTVLDNLYKSKKLTLKQTSEEIA